MNRITKIIHRVKFNTRQRRAVDHYRKYVISQNDVDKEKNRTKMHENTVDANKGDTKYQIRKLLKHFDPEDNKWDRRALFEVTGIRLYEGDFLESDTSDEETQALNRETKRQNHLNWLQKGTQSVWSNLRKSSNNIDRKTSSSNT